MLFQYVMLNNFIFILDLTFWIIQVSIICSIVIYTFIKYQSKSNEIEKLQKENILSWIGFLIFLGIANTLNIVWRFTIEELK